MVKHLMNWNDSIFNDSPSWMLDDSACPGGGYDVLSLENGVLLTTPCSTVIFWRMDPLICLVSDDRGLL